MVYQLHPLKFKLKSWPKPLFTVRSVNKRGKHVADGAVASLEEFREVLQMMTNQSTATDLGQDVEGLGLQKNL